MAMPQGRLEVLKRREREVERNRDRERESSQKMRGTGYIPKERGVRREGRKRSTNIGLK